MSNSFRSSFISRAWVPRSSLTSGAETPRRAWRSPSVLAVGAGFPEPPDDVASWWRSRHRSAVGCRCPWRDSPAAWPGRSVPTWRHRNAWRMAPRGAAAPENSALMTVFHQYADDGSSPAVTCITCISPWGVGCPGIDSQCLPSFGPWAPPAVPCAWIGSRITRSLKE